MPWQFKPRTPVYFNESILEKSNDRAGLVAGDRVIGLSIGDAENGLMIHAAKEEWQSLWDALKPLLEWVDDA